jgi:Flp pilus assembly protein TadG
MAGEAPTDGVLKEPLVRRLPRLRAFRRDQRGTAVVEFALVAPILFLLVFGILDFGRALNYYNQMTQLAGQGARAAIVNNNPDGTGPASGTSIQSQLVNNYANGGLQNGLKVCITNPSPPAAGQPVTLQATYKFSFLPLIGAVVGSPTITLTATQSERQEANPTYSVGCAP